MPRMSADAIAASYQRKAVAPAPPKHLSAFGRRLWRRITHSRPPDYFRPGADVLLEQFVHLEEMRLFYVDLWRKDPGNADHLKALAQIAAALNSTAVKLRISNSAAISSRSGILDEKAPIYDDDPKVRHLFGSSVKARGEGGF
jgi:hypothetical protein